MNRIFFLFVLAGLSLTSCRTAKLKPVKNKPAVDAHSENKEREFLEFINSWIGTPYLYGGCSQKGSDCSGLVYSTYKELYKMDIPRSTSEIFKRAKAIDEREVKAGDLVFFDIKSGSVSHVGMYISDRKFIHSSTKKGVIISSLDEDYYREHFKSFGSLR